MPSCARCVNLWPAAIAPSRCSCALSTRYSRVSLPERGAKSMPSAAPTPTPTANAEIDSLQLCFAVIKSSVFRLGFAAANPNFRSVSPLSQEKRRGSAELRAPSPGKLFHAAGSGATRAPVIRFEVGGRFARRGNILGAGGLHDLLGALDRLGAVAMHGQQNAALLHASFVALRFIFGNSHADQRPCAATDGATHTDSRYCSHDWSSSD